MNLINLTPRHLRCGAGYCPAVYRLSENQLVIVGKKASQELLQELTGTVGDDEYVSVIDDAFFEGVEAFKSGK